jgi:xanthine dehydrogenase YagS FAD-binding subunit
MRPFTYQRATDPDAAIEALAASGGNSSPTEARVQALAGGTTLIDLMKLDVMRPQALIDINPLAGFWSEINLEGGNLMLGALARMSDVAAHPELQHDYPVMAIMPTRARDVMSANLKLIRENNIRHSFDRWPQRDPASQNDVRKRLRVHVCWRHGF